MGKVTLWGMVLVFCRHGMLGCSWTEVRAGNDLRVSTDRCQRTLRLPLLAPRGPKPYLHTHKHSEGPSDANTLTYTNTRGSLSFTCPLVERDLNTVCFLVHNKVNCQVIMTFNCLGFILKLKRLLIECKIVLPVCWSVIAQKTQWSVFLISDVSANEVSAHFHYLNHWINDELTYCPLALSTRYYPV